MGRKRIVILGGGTGGTMVANRLRRRLGPEEASIVVVDVDDRHVYQPGLLFVPFGLADPYDLVRPRARQLRPGIAFRESSADAVSLGEQRVELEDGERLPYDVLVIATGARLLPGETDGLVEAEDAHTFYTLDGAVALRDALARFRGGRLVVNFVDMPIKCPVAPLEFAFLADWFLRERGLRAKTQLVLATPLDAAFTKPVAAAHLDGLLRAKDIELVTEFNVGEVVPGALVGYDEREVPFDLLATVPLHGGAPFAELTPGLGDALGFIRTDPHTLQARAAENVFALGDATDVPTSKAGSVTHFEAEVLADNVLRTLDGRALQEGFDGHANCFVETGFGKALLIDFNYDTEPLPGRFPGRVGLPLLRESRLNHAGKLAFAWIYWHALLPGRDLPLIGPAMPTAGKHTVAAMNGGGR